MKVLIITGMPGAGKSEAVKVATEMGIPVFNMGNIIKEDVLRRGFDVNRANMGSVANSERKKLGPDIWARRTVQNIPKNAPIVIIDGCRSMAEMDFFRHELGDSLLLIGIHTSPRTRWERVKSRGRSDDPASFEALMERDRQELEWGLGSVVASADIMLLNEGVKGSLRGLMRNLLIDLAANGDFKLAQNGKGAPVQMAHLSANISPVLPPENTQSPAGPKKETVTHLPAEETTFTELEE